MKSIQVTSIVGAFAGMAFASPFEIQARAPITSAAFSNFTVSCTSTECSISTTITLLPESTTITCAHTIPGSSLPTTGGIWTCSDPLVWPRYNRGPIPTAPYRIVLTDGRDPANGATVRYESPRTEWPGDREYIGPKEFTLV